MTTVIDLNAECAKLTKLKNRTPLSSEADRKGAFARVAPYRDGAIFTAKFAGKSAWERHPRGEEIVQIIDGATTLHLLTDEGKQSLSLTAGMIAIVPTKIERTASPYAFQKRGSAGALESAMRSNTPSLREPRQTAGAIS
jgi:hypothetical protein